MLLDSRLSATLPEAFSCSSWLAPLKVLPSRVTLALKLLSDTEPPVICEASIFVSPEASPLNTPVTASAPPIVTLPPLSCSLSVVVLEILPSPIVVLPAPITTPPKK